MDALLHKTKELRLDLEMFVNKRHELEKLVESKERKLQAAKERNRDPENHTEAQAFRMLQITENHKQKVAELEMLRDEMEDLAIMMVEAKDHQRDKLRSHQMIMKDLAQKFQSGPSTYLNQEEMKSKLCDLEKKYKLVSQKLKSVHEEEARKKATFQQLYPVDPIKSNTVALVGNMPAIMHKMSEQVKLELKESQAKENELQKKMKNLEIILSLLNKDIARTEAKMAE